MFTRFQGLALVVVSGVTIYVVATQEDIVWRAGPILGYVLAGLAGLLGLIMLITGENPLRDS